MTTECDDCPKCHKVGLPIIPVRYALAPKYDPGFAKMTANMTEEEYARCKDTPDFQMRHGKGVPELSGKFKALDKDRGSEIPLKASSAQYTLRRMRQGCIYVYNPHDPRKKWRCYAVSNNSLLTETSLTTPSTGKAEDKEKADYACNPEKNLMTAEIITIPYIPNLGDFWLWFAFSETKWTPDVLEKHQDAAYRNKHMRRVNVGSWMASGNPEHEHAACLHALDPKQPVIAEYVDSGASFNYPFSPAQFNPRVCNFKEAFSFSPAQFNHKGKGIDLAKARETLKKIANMPGMEILDKETSDQDISDVLTKLSTQGIEVVPYSNFPSRKEALTAIRAMANTAPSVQDGEIDGIARCLGSIFVNGHSLAESSSGDGCGSTPFEHLIQEMNRFYERAHKGMKKNEKYKGKAIILALDDPAGIVQDLNGMISDRLYAFGRFDKDRRLMAVNQCVDEIRARVMVNSAKEVAHHYKMEALFEKDGLTPKKDKRTMTAMEKEEFNAMLKGDSNAVKKRFEQVWKNDYETKFDVKKKDALNKDFDERFNNYRKSHISALATAHAKWMESDILAQCMTCNFDRGDSRDARNQCGGYVELFSRCVGITADLPECKPLYIKWLTTSPRDEKNLAWCTITCNSASLGNTVVSSPTKANDAQKKLAAASPEIKKAVLSGDNPGLDMIAENLSTWAKEWWTVIADLQLTLAHFTEADFNGRKHDVDAARKALEKAQKSMADVERAQNTIEKQMTSKDSRLQNTKLLNAHEAALERARLLRETPEYKAHQENIAAARKGIKTPEKTIMSQIEFQLRGPLEEAGKIAMRGEPAPNYPYVRVIFKGYSGKLDIDMKIHGTPRDHAIIQASRTRYTYDIKVENSFGSGASGEMVRGMPGDPKYSTNISYKVSAESEFIYEAMTIRSKTNIEAAAIVEFSGGNFSIDAKNAHGNASNVAEMSYGDFKNHAYANHYQQQIDTLTQELKSLKGSQTEVNAMAAERRSRLNSAETQYRQANARLTERQGIPSPNDITRGEKFMSTANVIFAGLVVWSFHRQLENLGKNLRFGDQKYNDALVLYGCSWAFIAGTSLELAHKALSSGAGVRVLNWAFGLRATVEDVAKYTVRFRVIGASAVAPLSAYTAYLDACKMVTAIDNDEIVWAIAYGSAAALGIGTAGLGILAAASIIAAPVALGVAIAYAVVSLGIAVFEPNASQKWLKGCLFAKNPAERYEADWLSSKEIKDMLEMREFRDAVPALPAASAQ